jgi:immune inhibitor A
MTGRLRCSLLAAAAVFLVSACSRPATVLRATATPPALQTTSSRSVIGAVTDEATPPSRPARIGRDTPVAESGGTPKIAAPEQPLPPSVSATPTPYPAPLADVAHLEAQTPARHLRELAARLRDIPPVTPSPISLPIDHPVGYQATFNVADQVNQRYFRVTATIRAETAHAYFYVQDDLPYDDPVVRQAAQTFESHIYPTDSAIFGSPQQPGIDGDRHISIVNAAVPGVGGYFSASDEYAPSVVPFSNARNIIYINTEAESIGSSAYLSTLAHELQHMIHWNVRPHDDSWANEGMSILAEHLNGYPAGSVVPLFLGSPDVQLDTWAAEPQAAVPHYGAAYLFIEYFLEHFGGPAIIKELLASHAPDLQMFANFLHRHAPGTTLSDVFANWVVANYLDDPSVAGGIYAYQDSSLHASLTGPPLLPGEARQDTVRQYAARYYEIPVGSARGTLTFQGRTTVQLMQQAPIVGREWWSNRADTMDTTLTRSVDLTGTPSAQLRFSLWMDIEDSYDYFYVEASRDGGTTWTTLPGTHSTTANPNGQNYGNGYTGKSGTATGTPGWWQEQVDLTPYVGSVILLRFEYVTDESYSGPGIGLQDIQIPAIQFDDAASDHSGWSASGWLLTDNQVPERYIVQVIVYGATPTVFRMTLDAGNRGSLSLDSLAQSGERVVVVVSALAPKTSDAGAFTLQLGP